MFFFVVCMLVSSLKTFILISKAFTLLNITPVVTPHPCNLVMKSIKCNEKCIDKHQSTVLHII
jgi:hypothetical protein